MKKIISVVTFLVAMSISILAYAYSNYTSRHAIILKDVCVQCGVCAEFCQREAIIKGDPYTVDVNKCAGCGACMDECAVGAIWLEESGR